MKTTARTREEFETAVESFLRRLAREFGAGSGGKELRYAYHGSRLTVDVQRLPDLEEGRPVAAFMLDISCENPQIMHGQLTFVTALDGRVYHHGEILGWWENLDGKELRTMFVQHVARAEPDLIEEIGGERFIRLEQDEYPTTEPFMKFAGCLTRFIFNMETLHCPHEH